MITQEILALYLRKRMQKWLEGWRDENHVREFESTGAREHDRISQNPRPDNRAAYSFQTPTAPSCNDNFTEEGYPANNQLGMFKRLFSFTSKSKAQLINQFKNYRDLILRAYVAAPLSLEEATALEEARRFMLVHAGIVVEEARGEQELLNCVITTEMIVTITDLIFLRRCITGDFNLDDEISRLDKFYNACQNLTPNYKHLAIVSDINQLLNDCEIQAYSIDLNSQMDEWTLFAFRHDYAIFHSFYGNAHWQFLENNNGNPILFQRKGMIARMHVVMCYEQAAQKNNQEALFKMGEINFREDLGFEVNPEKALSYYKRAAIPAGKNNLPHFLAQERIENIEKEYHLFVDRINKAVANVNYNHPNYNLIRHDVNTLPLSKSAWNTNENILLLAELNANFLTLKGIRLILNHLTDENITSENILKLNEWYENSNALDPFLDVALKMTSISGVLNSEQKRVMFLECAKKIKAGYAKAAFNSPIHNAVRLLSDACSIEYTNFISLSDPNDSIVVLGPNCEITCKDLKNIMITPNGHIYSRDGITQWLQDHNTDPQDRSPLTIDHVQTIAAQDNAGALTFLNLNVLQQLINIERLTFSSNYVNFVDECFAGNNFNKLLSLHPALLSDTNLPILNALDFTQLTPVNIANLNRTFKETGQIPEEFLCSALADLTAPTNRALTALVSDVLAEGSAAVASAPTQNTIDAASLPSAPPADDTLTPQNLR